MRRRRRIQSNSKIENSRPDEKREAALGQIATMGTPEPEPGFSFSAEPFTRYRRKTLLLFLLFWKEVVEKSLL
jgi:hypothetical protein